MKLLSSWRESLQLLLPGNLKVFLLVTAKTIVQTYTIWFKHFWWLLLIDLVLSVHKSGLLPMIVIPAQFLNLVWVVQSLAQTLMMVTFYLAVRPSVKRKTYRYFLGYVEYVALLAPFLVLMGIFLLSFQGFVLHVALCQVAFINFLIFFFFDSDGGLLDPVYALMRSAKMVIYNYPFVLLISVVSYGVYGAITAMMPGYGPWLFFPYSSIFVCIFANFYIKRVHEQFSLYYGNEEGT